MTIRVDAVCFPLNSALSVTQINDEQQTPLIHAYIRFKFYDKGKRHWGEDERGGERERRG